MHQDNALFSTGSVKVLPSSTYETACGNHANHRCTRFCRHSGTNRSQPELHTAGNIDTPRLTPPRPCVSQVSKNKALYENNVKNHEKAAKFKKTHSALQYYSVFFLELSRIPDFGQQRRSTGRAPARLQRKCKKNMKMICNKKKNNVKTCDVLFWWQMQRNTEITRKCAFVLHFS